MRTSGGWRFDWLCFLSYKMYTRLCSSDCPYSSGIVSGSVSQVSCIAFKGSTLSWTMFLATLSFILGSCRQCYLHCMGRILLWRWLQELANHYVCLWSRWPILIQQLGSLWAHSTHWWTSRYTQSFTLIAELCTLPFSIDHKTLPTWHTCNQSQRVQYQ